MCVNSAAVVGSSSTRRISFGRDAPLGGKSSVSWSMQHLLVIFGSHRFFPTRSSLELMHVPVRSKAVRLIGAGPPLLGAFSMGREGTLPQEQRGSGDSSNPLDQFAARGRRIFVEHHF